jgi:hypothetical protein
MASHVVHIINLFRQLPATNEMHCSSFFLLLASQLCVSQYNTTKKGLVTRLPIFSVPAVARAENTLPEVRKAEQGKILGLSTQMLLKSQPNSCAWHND